MDENFFDDFDWFIPREKKKISITIPNTSSFNLNSELVQTMPDRIAIGIKGIDTICIRQDDNGYKVPKNGSIKTREMIATLISNGLSLPAKYAVTSNDSWWIATLESTSQPIVIQPSKVSPKPRKRGLNKLIDNEASV